MNLKPMIITIIRGTDKGDGSTEKQKIKAEGDARIGLAIHQSTKLGTKLLVKNLWVITHIKSGRSVLRGMRSKESAISYLAKILEVCSDWTFTLEEYAKLDDETRGALKEYMDLLQREVYVRP